MQILKTNTLTKDQFKQINDLWNEEYPLSLQDRFPLLFDGVEKYNHYLVEDKEKNILAWAADFEKDGELRFSIIVDSKRQKMGLGSMLIEKLKSENNLLFGWVIDHSNDLKSNGAHYQTPLAFYQKHGFEILLDVRIESNLLNAVKIKWDRALTPI